MADFDWTPYLVGGGTRADAISGMDPRFSGALQQMFAGAPPEIQSQLRVSSGYRSPQVQETLWNQALAKYGSPDVARRWVAPPGRSNHNHGYAADLKYLSPAAQEWAHANAGNYGLAFPLSNENWHVELAGVRGGQPAPAPASGGTVVASAPPVGPAPAQPGVQPAPAPEMAAVPGITPPPNDLGSLAFAFIQNAQAQRQREAEQQAAEQTRKAALFGGPAPGRLSGLFA